MKNLIIVIFLLFSIGVSSQIFNKGIVTGPMTTVEINAIVSPQEGRLIGNSTTKTIWYYDGTQWVDTGVGGGGSESTTVSDSSELDFTLTGSDITASIIASSIDETKLDASTNASLDLADSALQSEVDGSTTNEIQNLSQVLTQGNDAGGLKIANLANPTLAQDAATKTYVDDNLTGGGIVAEGTTAVLNGSSTVTVTHGLGYVPSDTRIQLQEINSDFDSGSDPVVKNITSTTFDIEYGLSVSANAVYAWRIYGTGLLVGQVDTDDQTATEVPFTPNGSISSTNVQAAIQEVRDEAGAGGGNVTKVGTPVNDQLSVWTGDGTIEGTPLLTHDGATTTFRSNGTANMIIFRDASNNIKARFNANGDFTGWERIYNANVDIINRVNLANTAYFGWSADGTPTNASDTGISRLSAGSISIGNGTVGNTSGSVTAAQFIGGGAGLTGLSTLANANQVIPSGQLRTVIPGASGRLALQDSGGRTWFEVESNGIAPAEGNGYIGENITFREHGGTNDDIINLNFDFNAGTDQTIVATPTDITYNGISMLSGGGGGFANPATVNLNMNGFDVTGAGDVTLNPSGSTTTTPALLGFTGFSSGQATRFQFGDRYNSIQNGFDRTMDISAYHTLRLRGGTSGTPVNTDFQLGTATPDIGILLETFNLNRKIVVRGIASQAVDIFQVRNSADAVLFGVKNTGQGLFNQGVDMASTKIVNLATPTANTDAATKAYVDANGGNPLAIESDVTGLAGASAISNIVSGTQAEIDGWAADASRLDLCEDCPPAAQTTGTALDLGDYTQYNMSAANAGATYTTTNVKGGGYAEVLINKSGAAPTVTGATQLPNTAAFIASTNMILSVKAFGTTVKYWFTEY